MTALEIAFWACAGLLVYAQLGYGLLLAGIGRLRRGWSAPADPGEQQAVPELRVDEQPGAGPEGDLQRGHGRGLSRRRDS